MKVNRDITAEKRRGTSFARSISRFENDSCIKGESRSCVECQSPGFDEMISIQYENQNT
jgi:hypothetical protein